MKTMVFDIGGVFAHWRPEAVYEEVTPDPERRRRFFEEFGAHEWNLGFDAGRSMPMGVAEDAARHPEWAVEIRAWWERWEDTFREPAPGTAEVLRALKARGTPVVALTNFAAETLPIAQRLHPVLTEFDDIILSAAEGVVKPDPAIYAIVERRTGRAGPELFFTDDRPENVAAAQARGWRGHVFQGADGLIAALVEAGMLDGDPR